MTGFSNPQAIWDKRFSTPDYVFGEEPNAFLVSQAALIGKGQALAMDMRAGMDTLLSRVVLVFGAAQPYHAYLFVNARGSRLKIFIQDGYGMWMCTRRLAEGTFSWPRDVRELKHSLSREQLEALVVG
jgi:transposase